MMLGESNEITLSKIKDFLLSKGGKVKYSDLFDHFRCSIVDSSSGNELHLLKLKVLKIYLIKNIFRREVSRVCIKHSYEKI